MGAYGNTPEATCTPGDVNGDLTIDINDLMLVYDNMGIAAFLSSADIDGDGAVTFADLRIVYDHMAESERCPGGIPVTWVLEYMQPTDPTVPGLSPYEDQSQMDNDGDGRTNYEEYIAGTDPTDASSSFAVTDIRCVTEDGIVLLDISWDAVADKSYRLYNSESLGEDAVWSPVDGPYEITNGKATQRVAYDSSSVVLYFKVEVW